MGYIEENLISIHDLHVQRIDKIVFVKDARRTEGEPNDVTKQRLSEQNFVLPVLNRHSLIELLNALQKSSTRDVFYRNRVVRKIIRGGTGVGKSLTLFLCACWCASHDWDVCYFPWCSLEGEADSRLLSLRYLQSYNILPP